MIWYIKGVDKAYRSLMGFRIGLFGGIKQVFKSIIGLWNANSLRESWLIDIWAAI